MTKRFALAMIASAALAFVAAPAFAGRCIPIGGVAPPSNTLSSGYPLDSGAPNSLWSGPLSDPRARRGAHTARDRPRRPVERGGKRAGHDDASVDG